MWDTAERNNGKRYGKIMENLDQANVLFRLLIYSTNALKWDVTRIYLVKLFSGSNDKNGDATHSCKFAILKIALLVLFEIFLYYSKNEKNSKSAFLIELMQLMTRSIMVIW